MYLNYAIFRSELIYTIQDLANIGSHNKRENKSNSDIILLKIKENIELKPLAKKYVNGLLKCFNEHDMIPNNWNTFINGFKNSIKKYDKDNILVKIK